MEFDAQAAWLDLKQHLLGKRSHGQDELLRQLTELELKYRVPEDQRGFDPTPRRVSQPPTEALQGNGHGDVTNPTTSRGGRNGQHHPAAVA